MAQLIGVYVDEKYNIFVRKGDSGSVLIKGVPTDNNYKVSLGVVDPESGDIVKEISVFSMASSMVSIPVSVADTESLGEGRFLYGIKLTVGTSETTVIPTAYKNKGGCLNVPFPPTFNVLPKLVEG